MSPPHASSTSLSWDWDWDWDDDGPSAIASSEPSSSRAPSLASTPWLRDLEELAGVHDPFFALAAEYDGALLVRDAQLAGELWNDPEMVCQNTQKLFVSFFFLLFPSSSLFHSLTLTFFLPSSLRCALCFAFSPILTNPGPV